MNQLDPRRHAFRLGALITAAEAATLGIGLPHGAGVGEIFAVVAIVAVAAVGLGLMLDRRGARPIAAVLLGLSAVASLGTLVSAGPPGLDARSLLDGGNALASTVMIAWLCIAGIFGLLAPQRRTTIVTARLAGVCLAIIAIDHLYSASVMGFDLGLHGGGLMFRFSASGTALAGFPGWPIWHLVLLAGSIGLLFAPERKLARACRDLMVLFAILSVLGLSAVMSKLDLFNVVPLVVAWSFSLLPIYLAWWLRQEALALSQLAS